MFLKYAAGSRVLLLALIVVSGTLSAQDNNPLITNSGEIIANAIKLQSEDKYAESVEELRKIPENDTNYIHAMSELANSYYGLEQYDSVISISRRYLKEPNSHEHTFYISLGNALDASEKPEEAVTVLNEGLKKFPNSHLLYYNLGITNRKLKKYPEALENFKKAVSIYPYHAGSHLMIGFSYLEADQIVPAMMALSTFLLISPDSKNSADVVVILEKVAQIEYKDEEGIHFTLPASSNEDDFSEQETIIRSKIALSSKYKSQSKLNYDLVKQLQVLFEKLEYAPSDKGFCNQNYVPLYSELFKKDYFEPFSYYILASIDQSNIQSWLKKNEKKVEEMVVFAVDKMREMSEQNPVVVNNQSYTVRHWFEGGGLTAAGNLNSAEDNRNGQWFFFHENDMLWKEGKYDNSGKEQGEWKIYYDTGELMEIQPMKDGGANGVVKSFYRNGIPSLEVTYSGDNVDGPVKTYHFTGKVFRDFEMKEGIKNGKFVVYDQNGGKDEEGTYKNDQLDGNYKNYFRNGKLRTDCNYSEGKLNGSYVSYYSNGKKYHEGKYANDEPTGTMKYYYRSGKLSEERSYATDGKPTASWKEYNEDGVLVEETTFNGSGERVWDKNYDATDGKLWSQLNYKTDKVSEVIYFDKKGGVIANNPRTRGMSPLTGYYPDGQLFFKGQYKNDYRVGKWTTYYPNGQIKEIENYNDEGAYDGEYKSYFQNGSLHSEFTFKEGKEDGYYKSYFQNGKMAEEGWYIGGEKNGYWLSYNPLGTLTDREYYILGKMSGNQRYYDELGKLYKIELKEEGHLVKYMDFDTSGNLINTSAIKGGTGTLVSMYPNGKKRFELSLTNGWLQGPGKFYHMNGKVETEGNYVNDLREGEWKWYDLAGNLEKNTPYYEGDPEGKTSNYEKGKVSYSSFTLNGEADSTTSWFFPNGKAEQVTQYKNDKRHGTMKIYNEEGQLYVALNYKEDQLVSYSHPGPDGKLVPAKEVAKETGIVTTTFANGKKAFESEYKSGWREGKQVRYFSSGSVREERMYKNNLQDGTAKEYNAAGKVIKEESYVYGDRHGACKFYSDDGKLIRIENYYLDLPHGEWKYYDKAGKVIKTERYYLGELLT